MRLDRIKADTIMRRKQETSDSCVHDYEAMVRHLKKKVAQAEAATKTAQDEKAEEKHENKRIMT